MTRNKNNAKILGIVILSFIPMILYHAYVPLHSDQLRPGDPYFGLYLACLILTIALPVAVMLLLLGYKFQGTSSRKAIIFILFLFGFYGISGRMLYQRKQQHLANWGRQILGEVDEKKIVGSKVRVTFTYSVNDVTSHGTVDLAKSALSNIGQGKISITVSTKDPRIYSLNFSY